MDHTSSSQPPPGGSTFDDDDDDENGGGEGSVPQEQLFSARLVEYSQQNARLRREL